MSETDGTSEAPAKKSKLPVLIGIIGAIAAGGGGFFAANSGMIGGAPADESAESHATQSHATQGEHGEAHAPADEHAAANFDQPVFLPIEPVIVNMPPDARHSHLRFVIQLEVAPEKAGELEAQLPRIIDIMNAYLRAVSPEDFDERTILTQIRGHLIARFNVAFGPGAVRDLLVMEFLLS